MAHTADASSGYEIVAIDEATRTASNDSLRMVSATPMHAGPLMDSGSPLCR